MKTNSLYILILFFSSCLLSCNDYKTEKSTTQNEYQSFFNSNKESFEIIAKKCFDLEIKYANSDTLKKIFKESNYKNVIEKVDYLTLVDLKDYTAYNFKLKIKENKCVDFFLTRIFIPVKSDSLWHVGVIDKSPCF